MTPPWKPIDPGPMLHHVIRRGNVVHIVGKPIPGMLKINRDGCIISDHDAFIAVMTCGQRVKMNSGGRNRFTEQPVTCLVCLVGGYK